MGRKRIGITGAGGRIGGLLALHLQEEYDLRLFVFEAPVNKDTLCKTLSLSAATVLKDIKEREGIEIIKDLDLSNADALNGKFDGLDVIIHLAANADPWEKWDKIMGPNFASTFNIYEEANKAKVKRIIFASTNHTQHALSAKGPNEMEEIDFDKVGKPFQLSDTPFPDSMYAVSKLFGEDLGKLYAWKTGLESIALRIGWIKDFEKDDPSDLKGGTSEGYMRAIYLSHRDCIGFVKAAITYEMKEPNGIPFKMCYVCSNNDKKIWNMDDITALGYLPLDNAEKFFS